LIGFEEVRINKLILTQGDTLGKTNDPTSRNEGANNPRGKGLKASCGNDKDRPEDDVCATAKSVRLRVDVN
jgi:hypothetical protein